MQRREWRPAARVPCGRCRAAASSQAHGPGAEIRRRASAAELRHLVARQENVAGTPHGLDRLRLVGVELDLLPQARHTDIDAAVEREAAVLVRKIQQLL